MMFGKWRELNVKWSLGASSDFFSRHAAGGKSKEKDGEMNGAFVFLQIRCFILQAFSRLNWRRKKHRMFNRDIHK